MCCTKTGKYYVVHQFDVDSAQQYWSNQEILFANFQKNCLLGDSTTRTDCKLWRALEFLLLLLVFWLAIVRGNNLILETPN